ncbi:MAG TPA: hypothetical protein VFQ53_28705 [Kofleriaceae bacterium]|nr:hypothetical protein [Kofleriaceae bacterium]
MTRRPASTLLAVCAIATTSTAYANPAGEHRPPHAVTTDARPPAPPPPTPTPPPPSTVEVPPVLHAALSALGIVTPRRLPSGAPACGNVATKAPRPERCR